MTVHHPALTTFSRDDVASNADTPQHRGIFTAMNASRAPWICGNLRAPMSQFRTAQQRSTLNPHLTKSRLNDAPCLCEMLHRNLTGHGTSRGTKWNRLGAKCMSKSTGALAARKRKSSFRKAISHNLAGGAAVACLVLASGWTVYSNILSASVYPTLGSAGFDEPVVKRPPVVAARSAAPDFKDRFASLSEPPVIAKPATVSAISATQFNERFAAAEPQSVASAVPAEPAAAPAQKIPAPKLVEAPQP